MIRIGITVGDPAGIGPEVISKALRAGAARDSRLFVYGDVRAVDRAGGLPSDAKGIEISTGGRVEPGAPDPSTAGGVVEAIRRAARDCLDGTLDCMVTGLRGGAAGSAGRNTVWFHDGETRELPHRVTLELAVGDRLRVETPGGGGFGAV